MAISNSDIQTHLKAERDRLLTGASNLDLPWTYREACRELAEAAANLLEIRSAGIARQHAHPALRALQSSLDRAEREVAQDAPALTPGSARTAALAPTHAP